MNWSFSRVDTYQYCPRKYELANILQLTKPQVSSTPMTKGSGVHAGLSYALHVYTETDYTITLDELIPYVNEFLDMWASANILETEDGITFEVLVYEIKEIVKRTLEHLDVPKNWRTVLLEGTPLIEYRGELPFGDDVFVFQVDWVAVDLTTGETCLIDWKTRATFTDEAAEQYSLQLSLYEYALSELGVSVQCAITYQILSDVPRYPEVTRSGRLSLMRIRTTVDVFMHAIQMNGESVTDPYYAEILQYYKEQENQWWLPVRVYRSMYTQSMRWHTFTQWVDRIKQDQIYPKMTGNKCRFCTFNRLCLAEDRGDDLEMIMENEYERKV